MACIEIKTKKYQTCKGSHYYAKVCKGLTMKDNDGKDLNKKIETSKNNIKTKIIYKHNIW